MSLTINIEDEFPWDERTSLVIYASNALYSHPDESFPSLIFHNYQKEKWDLMSDSAPYITNLDAEDMLIDVQRWVKNASEISYTQAISTLQWVEIKCNEGFTHFCYELEPPAFAGNAYKWARHADSKMR